jgi:phage-related protein
MSKSIKNSAKKTLPIVSLLGNFPYICPVDKKKKHRTIIFYKSYFDDFFSEQKQKVKDKIIWTFDLIEELQRVPETYLKHLESTDGLFEIRIQQGSDIFRIFCFFDQGQLVVLANGFQKKTQKTPKKEIEKALKIKEEYESEKK